MFKKSFYMKDVLLNILYEQGEIDQEKTIKVKSIEDKYGKISGYTGYTFPNIDGFARNNYIICGKDDILTIKYEPITTRRASQ